MKNINDIHYRHGRIPWGVYVFTLAELIDKPAEIVGSYLSANPWSAIGQRVCETYHVDYARDGGYPCMVGREFVEATSVAELRDLASSVHAWENRVYHLYVVARNAGAYGTPDMLTLIRHIRLGDLADLEC